MTLLFFLALLFAPQDKPPEKCSLSGIVVSSVTGDPLNKVELMLEPLDRSAGPVATATSNADGRFTMLDLDWGRYHLGAARNGYLEMSYGARRPDMEGTVIQLAQGQCPGALTFKLTPFGVIAGTVRDSDGEPLIDAGVHLGRRTIEHGKPSMEGYDSTMTDDLGQYRFRDLPPGKYYISAEPRATGRNKVDHSPNSKESVFASIPTLYPGVRDRALATPIEVAAGARVAGIDVTLLRSRVFNVTGRLILPNGAGAERGSLELADLSGVKNFELRTVTKNAQGDFELRGVAPGYYLLKAGTSNGALSGATRIDVASDLEGVRVQLGALALVKGRMIAEGDKKPNLSGRRIFFFSGTRDDFIESSEIANDAFSASAPPGHYTIEMSSYLPQGFYLKNVRSNDIDVLNDGLPIDQSGTIAVEITLASDGGKLDGTVEPPSAATVVLVPSRRNRTDLFKTAATDQYGHYEFNSIPPGDYKLFAWDDIAPGELFDPDFLKGFEKYGEAVTVQPNSHTFMQLRVVITEPR